MVSPIFKLFNFASCSLIIQSPSFLNISPCSIFLLPVLKSLLISGLVVALREALGRLSVV